MVRSIRYHDHCSGSQSLALYPSIPDHVVKVLVWEPYLRLNITLSSTVARTDTRIRTRGYLWLEQAAKAKAGRPTADVVVADNDEENEDAAEEEEGEEAVDEDESGDEMGGDGDGDDGYDGCGELACDDPGCRAVQDSAAFARLSLGLGALRCHACGRPVQRRRPNPFFVGAARRRKRLRPGAGHGADGEPMGVGADSGPSGTRAVD